jgi:hypothetical protein
MRIIIGIYLLIQYYLSLLQNYWNSLILVTIQLRYDFRASLVFRTSTKRTLSLFCSRLAYWEPSPSWLEPFHSVGFCYPPRPTDIVTYLLYVSPPVSLLSMEAVPKLQFWNSLHELCIFTCGIQAFRMETCSRTFKKIP